MTRKVEAALEVIDKATSDSWLSATQLGRDLIVALRVLSVEARESDESAFYSGFSRGWLKRHADPTEEVWTSKREALAVWKSRHR